MQLEQEALLKADAGGDVKDTLREQLFRKERKLRHLLFVGAQAGRSLRSAVMPYSGPRYANTNRLCLRSWSVVSRPNLDPDYHFPPELQPLQPGEGESLEGPPQEEEDRVQGEEDEEEEEVYASGDAVAMLSKEQIGDGKKDDKKAGKDKAESQAIEPTYVLAPHPDTGYENPYEEPLLPEPYHFSSYDRLFDHLHDELLRLCQEWQESCCTPKSNNNAGGQNVGAGGAFEQSGILFGSGGAASSATVGGARLGGMSPLPQSEMRPSSPTPGRLGMMSPGPLLGGGAGGSTIKRGPRPSSRRSVAAAASSARLRSLSSYADG